MQKKFGEVWAAGVRWGVTTGRILTSALQGISLGELLTLYKLVMVTMDDGRGSTMASRR